MIKIIKEFLLTGFIIFTLFVVSFAMDSTTSVENKYTLPELIDFATKNNPKIISYTKDIDSESYNIKAVKAEENVKLDFTSGYSKYRYKSPVTPIVFGSGSINPVVDDDILDYGVNFRMPLFNNGRIEKNINIAELKKNLAENNLKISIQELNYNITIIYYKIIQFDKLLESNDKLIKQIEAHKNNVEIFVKSGTAAQLDLLKVEVELSRAKENRLIIKNNLEGTYEFLKAIIGVSDLDKPLNIVKEMPIVDNIPVLGDINNIYNLRPEYNSVINGISISDKKIEIVKNRRLPEVYLSGEFTEKSSDKFSFKENWAVGVRVTVPIFDGGITASDIAREKNEKDKKIEEERALKLNITREVKDAYRNIETVKQRIEVTEKAIVMAKEALRVETLKYQTGTGISSDVLDAETVLLRVETDYYQALYDKQVAIALLNKALGK